MQRRTVLYHSVHARSSHISLRRLFRIVTKVQSTASSRELILLDSSRVRRASISRQSAHGCFPQLWSTGPREKRASLYPENVLSKPISLHLEHNSSSPKSLATFNRYLAFNITNLQRGQESCQVPIGHQLLLPSRLLGSGCFPSKLDCHHCKSSSLESVAAHSLHSFLLLGFSRIFRRPFGLLGRGYSKISLVRYRLFGRAYRNTNGIVISRVTCWVNK
ncbi:hypothetical protein V2W45_774750 [Cenococcum geophilum]